MYGADNTEKMRGSVSKNEFLDATQKSLMLRNSQFIKQIDKIGFTNKGGGVYTIDTKIGGGQIEAETDSFGNTAYNTHVWNATYNSWKDTKWSSLNAAKAYVKTKLKGI